MSFWSEFRRRNVGRVAVAYGVLAWLLIQIAVVVFPQLDLPASAARLVTVLLLIGFPIALVFAWVYEVTPEGIKRTSDVAPTESTASRTGRKLDYVVIGLLVLAIGFLLTDRFVLGPSIGVPATAPAAQAAPGRELAEPAKTIAVLPFANMSSDPEQSFFADGLSEELLNSLAQISELRVTARTSSFAFKGSTQTVQQIGEVLGVEHILEGSVRKAADTVRITAQLIRAGDGFHLWSETYDRSLGDIFTVQEEIATVVADKLSATLGIERPDRARGGTQNAEAYELFLAARGQTGNPNTAPAALESIDAALALDPNFARGWILKASIHNFLVQMIRADDIGRMQEGGLAAAERALELEPDLAVAHVFVAIAQSNSKEWTAAEESFRRAFALSADPAEDYSYAVHLLALGHVARARELLDAVRQNDPLNQTVRGFSLLARALAGDMPGAEADFSRGTTLFNGTWLGEWFITMARLTAGSSMDPADVAQRGPIHDEVLERIDEPEEALAWLRALFPRATRISPSASVYASLYGLLHSVIPSSHWTR
jgi:adenylate cyclase